MLETRTEIHHVSVGTNDLDRAKAFYDPLMSLIGFQLPKLSDNAHYGASDIFFETPVDGLSDTPGNGFHIAFSSAGSGNRPAVS
jgi:catechol 2,3-dioxygenase-like lactoylglutathione lyase family enzyme